MQANQDHKILAFVFVVQIVLDHQRIIMRTLSIVDTNTIQMV